MKRLRLVLYGQAKIGKTSTVESAPGPRLILDSEGGADFLEKPTLEWTDVTQAPPVAPAEWGKDYNVVLFIRDWSVFEVAHQWLQSGKHQFNTVAIDSLSDIQKRAKDTITGTFDMQAWGVLLNKMDVVMRQIRDLTKHPKKPLMCIILTALVKEGKTGMLTPRLQGGFAEDLPGLFDVIGYMRTTENEIDREIVIAPSRRWEAGDRTKLLTRHYGQAIPLVLDKDGKLTSGGITDMLRVLNPKPVATAAAPQETAASE